MTVGDTRSAYNPMIYTHGSNPVPSSGSVVITQGSPWYGSVVGVYRKQGQEDQYVITLCEVVIIGTRVIQGVYPFRCQPLSTFREVGLTLFTYQYISDCSCPSGVTCDTFNGCAWCPNGTRLPDCKLGSLDCCLSI